MSNSELNLNWNRLDPTLGICNPSFSPYALLIMFVAALLLKGLQVRNFPIKLRLQLSIPTSLPSSEISIISSSSVVNFIFSRLSITSSAMENQKKGTERVNGIG